MIGDPCRYDREFRCFRWGSCRCQDLTTCLKISVVSMANEIETMKHRQMKKHTEASIKWRNQALYARKKVKTLQQLLIKHGIEPPPVKELVGGNDGRICNNDTAEMEREGHPINTDD